MSTDATNDPPLNQQLVIQTKPKSVSITTSHTEATGVANKCTDVAKLKQNIVACQKELAVLVAGTLAKAIELGDLLLQLRQQLPHGSFLSWIEKELQPICGVKPRTAQRYMHLARHRDVVERRLRKSESAQTLLSVKGSFNQIFMGLKIRDGESPLQEQSHSHEEYTDRQIPASILHSSEELLIHLDTSSITHIELPQELQSIPTNFCLFHVRSNNLNTQAVSQLSELLRQQAAFGFLWISSHRLGHWVTQLNAYPRVCVFNSYSQNVTPQSHWWLYGLIGQKHFDKFASVFNAVGDVLIPYANL